MGVLKKKTGWRHEEIIRLIIYNNVSVTVFLFFVFWFVWVYQSERGNTL